MFFRVLLLVSCLTLVISTKVKDEAHNEVSEEKEHGEVISAKVKDEAQNEVSDASKKVNDAENAQEIESSDIDDIDEASYEDKHGEVVADNSQSVKVERRHNTILSSRIQT